MPRTHRESVRVPASTAIAAAKPRPSTIALPSSLGASIAAAITIHSSGTPATAQVSTATTAIAAGPLPSTLSTAISQTAASATRSAQRLLASTPKRATITATAIIATSDAASLAPTVNAAIAAGATLFTSTASTTLGTTATDATAMYTTATAAITSHNTTAATTAHYPTKPSTGPRSAIPSRSAVGSKALVPFAPPPKANLWPPPIRVLDQHALHQQCHLRYECDLLAAATSTIPTAHVATTPTIPSKRPSLPTCRTSAIRAISSIPTTRSLGRSKDQRVARALTHPYAGSQRNDRAGRRVKAQHL